MRRVSWRLPFAALVVATLALLAAGAAWADVEGSFERTLNVTGPVNLTVKTGSGAIRVEAGESGRVHVVGRIKARTGWRDSEKSAEEKVRYLEQNPPIEQEGNTIRIGEIEDDDLKRNVSISYEIVVPAQTELAATSGSGSIAASGVNGPVRGTTGSGSVSLAQIGSEARARTGSGSISLESVKGAVDARTGSGSIRATGVTGDLHASTGSGSVRVEQSGLGEVDVSTGSGSIVLDSVQGSLSASTGSGSISAQGALGGDWKLSAGSGGITVALPPEAAFDLYAKTNSGSVSTDHPVTVQGTLKRGEMRGKVRGGGTLVELRTGSGNIRIQ